MAHTNGTLASLVPNWGRTNKQILFPIKNCFTNFQEFRNTPRSLNIFQSLNFILTEVDAHYSQTPQVNRKNKLVLIFSLICQCSTAAGGMFDNCLNQEFINSRIKIWVTLQNKIPHTDHFKTSDSASKNFEIKQTYVTNVDMHH